jgi:hypothetical protein
MDEALASDRVAETFSWMQGDLVGMISDPARRSELEEALGRIAAADLVCVMVGGEPGPVSEQDGVEGVGRAWEDWLEPWESYDLRFEELIPADGAFVVLGRVRARTKTDGVEVEHAPAAVLFFREDALTRLEFHLDRRLAFAAAGLPRPDG